MRYLVTGGAGFIGSHIAERLAEEGHDVIIMDNLATGKEENLRTIRKKVILIKKSITDEAALRSALKGVHGIFHQAAIPSVPRSIKDPLTTHDANLTGTLRLLWHAKESGTKRVVFASSSSVYGTEQRLPQREDCIGSVLSPYALTKRTSEEYLRLFWEHYQLETVSLRYFNVFGPRQDPTSMYAGVIPKFITSLRNGQPPEVYGDGKQTRDFTYVSNVVEANLLAMHTPAAAGEVFNIACGKSHSVLELIRALNKALGTRINARFIGKRPGDIINSQADISKAKRILGFRPQITFEEGIARTVTSYTQ